MNSSPTIAARKRSIGFAASSATTPRSRTTRSPIHIRRYRDEPALAEVRARLSSVGLHPSALPLGVDRDVWLARAKTPWDCYPDTRTGKMDAETCALEKALKDPDIKLETDADVRRLIAGPDGRIVAVEYRRRGELKRLTPKNRRRLRRGDKVGCASAGFARRRQSEWSGEPLGHGRPQFHESQLDSDDSRQSPVSKRRDSPEDVRSQRLLSRGRQGASAARQHTAVWSGLWRGDEISREAHTARLVEPALAPCGGFPRAERGFAEPRKSGPSRW